MLPPATKSYRQMATGLKTGRQTIGRSWIGEPVGAIKSARISSKATQVPALAG
jgi:hypothetical protein